MNTAATLIIQGLVPSLTDAAWRAATRVAVAVTLLAAPSRGAEGETAALGWVRLDGAGACPNAHDLAKRIEARVGRRVLVSASEATMLVEAHVRATDAGGLEASIETARADGSALGTRKLSSPGLDCAELADKIALVIAVTIDPNAALDSKSAPKPLPVKPAAPAQPAPVRPEIRIVVNRERIVVRDVPRPARPWRTAARVAATASVGLLPGVTPGVSAAVLAQAPGFVPLELSGHVWLEREVNVDSGGAQFSLFAAGLAACPRVALRPVQLELCGGVTVGSMRARGFGFDDRAEQARAVALVTAGARLGASLTGPLSLFGGAQIHGAVVRPRFFYEDQNGSQRDVHRSAPVGGMAELGLAFDFSS